MYKLKFAAIVVLALTASALSFARPAAAAPAKNYSIFFYKPGTEVFGTLANGVFKQKSSVSTTKSWDLAAISRSTLVLYNRTSGATQTGTLTNGVYVKKHTYTLTPGMDLAAASCDSVMLYRLNTWPPRATRTSAATSRATP